MPLIVLNKAVLLLLYLVDVVTLTSFCHLAESLWFKWFNIKYTILNNNIMFFQIYFIRSLSEFNKIKSVIEAVCCMIKIQIKYIWIIICL